MNHEIMRRIAVHPSFLLYLLMIALIDGMELVCGFLVAMFVHEMGHACAAHVLKMPFERIELLPFGGVITYRIVGNAFHGLKGAIIASGGPLGNYAAMLFFSQMTFCKGFLSEMLKAVVIVSASMMLINLLPVLPLDGGRIVFCALHGLVPLAPLTQILTAMGVAAGAALVSLAIYGLVCVHTLNLSLLIVGLYIALSAVRERQILIIGEKIQRAYAIHKCTQDKTI